MSTQNKAELILDTAKKIFSEKGFYNVSTKEIAICADVNEITIFRNFKSKENLYIKVFEHFFNKSNFNPDSLKDIDSPHEYLLTLGKKMISMFSQNVDLIRMEIKRDIWVDNLELPLATYSKIVAESVTRYLSKKLSLSRKKIRDILSVYFGSIFGMFFKKTISKDTAFDIDFDSSILFLVDALINQIKCERIKNGKS